MTRQLLRAIDPKTKRVIIWRILAGVPALAVLSFPLLDASELTQELLSPKFYWLKSVSCGATSRARLFGGVETLLCVRCSALLVGLAGGAVQPAFRAGSERWLVAFLFCLVVLALDVVSEAVGLRGPAPSLRVLTGAAAGWTAGRLLTKALSGGPPSNS